MRHRRKRRTQPPLLPCIAFSIVLMVVIATLGKSATRDVATPDTASVEQLVGKLENADFSTVSTVEPVAGGKPEQVTEEAEAAPQRNERYREIEVTGEDRDLMAKVIFLEAGNQCFEGQQAVAEVIFNRVLHSGFPETVNEVLWQKGQFAVMPNIGVAEPTQTQYDAIEAALYGETVLDLDVVFFARAPENDRIWGWIEDHAFCREYLWRTP